jgi:hypothetical protein
VALEQLTSDLSLISNWGRENMVFFNASKTQFLHLYTQHNLPHNYIFFENTQLKPSSFLNILGVSFSCDLSWEDHIISLSKQASKRLGVLRRLQHFFNLPQLLALYRGGVRPCMEYASHIWGGSLIQLSLKRWSLGLFALSTLLLSLILYNLFLPVELFLTLSILSLLQWALLF